MNKSIFSYSFAYALIVFIGFFDAYSYYFCFGIEVSSFMTTGEILTSFFPKTLIILPLIGLLFISYAFKKTSNEKTLLSSTQVIINIIDALKFCISKNKVTLKSIFEILIYLTKILIIIFFWIGFLSYPLIIGWYLFNTEVTYQLLVFDGSLFTEFMIFKIFVAINYLHDKKLFSYLMVYGAIVCTLTFIGINNRKKARLIISGQPTHYVTYSIESKLKSTNENYLFIGVIKNYLFFRNSIDGSNSIVKIEDVSKLRIKKLIN